MRELRAARPFRWKYRDIPTPCRYRPPTHDRIRFANRAFRTSGSAANRSVFLFRVSTCTAAV